MNIRPVLVAFAVAVIAAACGGGGGDHAAHDGSSTRTVDIAMHDIDFSLSALTVQRGETIKFVFQNSGALVHDAFIGDEAAQQEHEMEMSSASSMGGMGVPESDAEQVMHERADRIAERPERQRRARAHDVPEPRDRLADVRNRDPDVVEAA